MNILVVDDEVLVRLGMKAIFERAGKDYRVMEACDGQQALELYTRYKPALVFVDITMPVMDGLQFISLAKGAGIKTKFVVLTCHDELELVRKSIKLGVSDYIIKTAMNDREVLALSEEVRRELNEDAFPVVPERGEEYKEQAKENVIKNILRSEPPDSSLIHELAEKYDIEFLKRRFAVILLSSKKLKTLPKGPVMNIIRQLLEEYLGGYLLELESGRLLIFLTLEDASGKQDFLEEFCSRIMKSMNLYFNIDASLGVCVCESNAEIARCIRNAETALQNRFFYKQPAVLFYRKESSRTMDIRILEYYRDEMAGLLSIMDYHKAAGVFSEWTTSLVENKPGNRGDVYGTFIQLHYIFMQHLAQHFKGVEGRVFENFRSVNLHEEHENLFEIACVFEALLEKMETLCEEERSKYRERIIRRAKAYILDHLNEETDLETVARKVGLSSNYFSELFREVTGEKFIDYVIRIKIDKAMEYIGKGEKVYSVMEKLGYNNYSYFCRLFRKVTGKSLKQFRK